MPDQRIWVSLASPHDTESWARLRFLLWPEGTQAEHRAEAEAFFADSTTPQAVLLAEVDAGWFVVAEARGRGIGKTLVTAAEEWARAQGYPATAQRMSLTTW